jgi:hypothetical protein
MFTHRKRACARACMIKYSLIYGPILLTFAVNILKITSSRMGYLLFMFTHCAHTCKCARASAWLKHSLIFERILFKFCWAHTTNDHTLYGLQLGRRARGNHNPRTLTALRLAFIQEFWLFPRNLLLRCVSSMRQRITACISPTAVIHDTDDFGDDQMLILINY